MREFSRRFTIAEDEVEPFLSTDHTGSLRKSSWIVFHRSVTCYVHRIGPRRSIIRRPADKEIGLLHSTRRISDVGIRHIDCPILTQHSKGEGVVVIYI